MFLFFNYHGELLKHSAQVVWVRVPVPFGVGAEFGLMFDGVVPGNDIALARDGIKADGEGQPAVEGLFQEI